MIRRTPWMQQPQIRLGVNCANPVTTGIAQMLDGTSDFDSATGKQLTRIGAPVQQAGSSGVAWAFDGSSTALTETQPSITGENFTIVTRVRFNTASGTGNLFTAGVGATYAYQLRHDGTQLSFYQFNGADFLCSLASFVTAGLECTIAASHDGVTMRLYVDGVLRSSVAASPCIRAADQIIWGRELSVVQWFNGLIYYSRRFRRVLSDAEVFALSASPYQLFAPLMRQFPGSANADVFYPIFYIRA